MSGNPASNPPINIAIHGIRDYGEWQYKFAATFRNSEVFRYEYFWLERFLLEFMHSSEISNRVARRIRALCGSNAVNIICHSYGTHILFNALSDNEDIFVNNVVFCGAIANPDSRLDLICARKQIRGRLYNFAGTHDIWPPCASLLSRTFFPSGVNGVGHSIAVNIYEPVGHGAFLNELLWEKYKWNDLFQGTILKGTAVSPRSTAVSTILWLSIHRWILLFIIISAIFFSWALITKSYSWTCSFRECSYDVTQRIQYREEPAAEGRPWVIQENLAVYKFDYGIKKVDLGAVSSLEGEVISFHDLLGPVNSKVYETPSPNNNDTTSYFPLAIVNRQAIALTWTRWIKADPEKYPGGVDLTARKRLRNIKVTVQVPQHAKLLPYDLQHHLNAVFRYKVSRNRNEFLDAELMRGKCTLVKDASGTVQKDIVEIECNNIDLNPGDGFRYCFSLFNWENTKIITRTNDCAFLVKSTGGTLPPVPATPPL